MKNYLLVSVLFIINLNMANILKCQPDTPDPNMWVTNGTVYAIAVDGNYTYIGGEFTYVGPIMERGAKITTTSTLPNISFPNVNATINTSVPDGSGGWYIGGNFTKVGSYDRNRLAHINSDGTVNPTWNPNANGSVITIARSGNDIFVVGFFNGTNSIGGQTRNYIAKLNNTTGEADPTWNPNANGNVWTISIDGNDIYAGGDFTSIGGQTRNRIAKLNNSNGAADPTWDPNSNGIVRTISISGSDIYVGGLFSGANSIGGQTRNRIAKLNNSTGAADASWDPNANGTVYTIAISGNDIYAGGLFNGANSIGGQTRNRVAKLNNSTGAANATWNPDASNAVNTIVISGSDIYVGGDFLTIGGETRNRIAKLNNTNGNADVTWDPNSTGTVWTIAMNGSDIYVGGNYTSIGGKTRNRLAKINNTTGIVDESWNPNANGTVFTLAISGSDIYVGGSFNGANSINGNTTRNRLAKLNNSTGGVNADWNPNANSTVRTIALSGSDIYVGGDFTLVGELTRNRLAKINNSTGIVEESWNPNANGTVSTFAISGSDIYVGGSFTNIGGQTRNRIAMLNSTNGNAASWNPSANGPVYTFAISGEDIYVGGNFTTIAGQSRNRIAKLNSTNGNAASWDPNANSQVRTIAISGSYIYVGGNFTIIGGQSRDKMAKLNISDGNAASWNPSANLLAYTIAISGSDIYVGGAFTTIGGNTQNYFALFTERTLPVELTSFTSNYKNGRVSLNWQTATEVNNYGFEVERSNASSNFKWDKIGFVHGHGNSYSPKDYSFSDNNPPAGNIKYRLKQIDNDGTFSYSDEVNVVNEAPKEFALQQNYPNPFNPSTTINYQLAKDGFVSLKVYDIIGREVASLVNREMKAGKHSVEFNASNNLASGTYFYELKAGDFVSIKKLLLMK